MILWTGQRLVKLVASFHNKSDLAWNGHDDKLPSKKITLPMVHVDWSEWRVNFELIQSATFVQ